MNVEMITGLLRHVLTFGGGYLVTKGVVDEGTLELGIGAIVTLVGIGWSAFAKKQPAQPVA